MPLLIGLCSPPTGTYCGLREQGGGIHELLALTLSGPPEPVSRRVQQRSQGTGLIIAEGRGVGDVLFSNLDLVALLAGPVTGRVDE